MLGKENKEEQVTGNKSSLIRMQEDTLLSSSQQMPIDLDLPEGFIIGKATDEGDCFFHAVAQGLKHLKPDINFTIKSLRNTCKAFAQSQLNLDSSWFIQALKDNKQDINYYLSFIEFTEGDMEKGPKVINKEIVLTTPIWGLPEIEGRIICIVYRVRLHFIEKHITRDGENVIMHHLIDREGYQKDALDREIFNKEVYYRKDTIHIINEGNLHFEPILRGEAQRILLHYYNTMASEKKSDSESVYFRQNFEAEMKDVTDNQMDCEYYKKPSPVVEVLPADSTTGTIIDDEDRLSDEELQYKQSQESLINFRVTSSSSTSKDISDSVWYSTLTNLRSTVDDIGFTDDRIGKRATFFVKTFTREFEKKVREYSEEAKPNSNVRKPGKFTTESDFAIKGSAGPGLSVPTVDPISLGGQVFYAAPKKIFDIYLTKGHRKKAKVISEVIHSSKYDQKKILIEAGLEIFQSFEGQFVGVTDVGSSFWERGIEKLAIDAVSRVINYISANSEEKRFSVDLITKGLILGESKDNTLVQCVFHKPVELLMKNNDTCIGSFLNKLKMLSNLRKLQLGYRIQDGQNLLVTSQLYKGVGIERKDNNTTSHYQSKKYNYAEEYGYRLPFAWELKKWSNESIEKEYKLVTTPKERYVYILDNGKKEKLANSILKEINGKDLAQKKDIEELCEKIENFQKNKEENVCPFLFNIGPLPRLFVKRRRMLLDLANMLDKESQELEMSRMVLISGKHGTGKSELAKSYAYDKGNGTWKNIIWIDAEMPSILLSSFHRLAQELEISIEKGKGIERIDVKVKTERQPEKKIKSIIEDIYKNFRDARSLFIFDNVSNYKDIEEFLPSYFFHLFAGREKPYVLITSRNKDWKEEIEKINLDKGFTLSEAIEFIETALGIDGRLCDADLITKLAKTLHYSPLALKRATSCIREEGGSISQYLERYSKVMQESSLDYLKEQNISPELFTTFKINFDKIKEEKNVGQQSHDILASMAYLSPGPIDTAEFFFQEESEKDQQNASDALSLLDKFSVIELEESIARVHMVVQKTIRLEKEQEGAEEEILRKIMTSIMDSDTTNIDHIVSVWSYASKYKELVNDFINSTYNGNTILHLLAISNNKEVIELILDKIDPNKLSKVINAVDKKKCAPLDYAAIYGHLEMVKYFIEEGSDLDIGSNRDLTPLHWAALHGQLEVVKHFIDNEYWEVDKLSGESGAPLHYAVISGNIDIVRYLVVKGADVNLQDESTGPLHYAVQEGHLDIVQYLIEKGAGVNLRDKNGMYPLHYAIKNGFLDIAKCLIDKGANINLRDRDNMSPLCYANQSDRLDMIKYLVKEKAIANLCKKNVANSLYYGTENDRSDIAKCLIKEKISIILNNFDEVSMSFFYCDDLHDRLNNIKSLIMRSTMVDPLNKEGMSSLHLAIIYGRLDLIDQFVREEEADVNEQVREGMCLLHIAAACNHLDIIDYLVKKGANINEQNREGLSPLHIAVIHAHPGIVKYLIEKGADINLNDRCGMSPLFYALAITIGHPRISFDLIKYSSSLAQGIDVESVFNNLLHNDNPNVICYPEAQPSALDLRVQSHKRHRKGFTYSSKSKKRKLENISAIPKENASNVELLQGSRNLPLDVSMQFEGLADRMKDMVEKSMNNINSEMPACSFNSIAVESVNNKNLRR